MGKVLFFRKVSCSRDAAVPDAVPDAVPGLRSEFWRPSAYRLVPEGMRLFPFSVWWVFHFLRVFWSQEYCVFTVRDPRGRVVHHSVVTPGYLRFPFMKRGDLQIGNVWTAEDQRGKGLAVFGIRSILHACGRPGRTFWYLLEKENAASIRAAEKAGLELCGTGRRRSRLGISVLGYYELTSGETESSAGAEGPPR